MNVSSTSSYGGITPEKPELKENNSLSKLFFQKLAGLKATPGNLKSFIASKSLPKESIKEKAVAAKRFAENLVIIGKEGAKRGTEKLADLLESSKSPISEIERGLQEKTIADRGAKLASLQFKGKRMDRDSATKIARFIENEVKRNPDKFLNGKKSATVRKEDHPNLPHSLRLTRENGKLRIFINQKELLGQGADKTVKLSIEYGENPQFFASGTINLSKKSGGDLEALQAYRENVKSEITFFRRAIPKSQPAVLEYTGKKSGNIKVTIQTPLARGGDVLSKIGTPEWDAIKNDVAESALKMLVDAHKKGISNRDIKPANILIDFDAKGKAIAAITDWGTAAEIGNKDAYHEGTHQFIPSDTIQSQNWEKHDVFSTGITLSQMLQTKIPSWVENSFDQMGYPHNDYEKHWKEDFAKSPTKLDYLVHDMTHPDPDRRPSMQEALSRFKEIRREA